VVPRGSADENILQLRRIGLGPGVFNQGFVHHFQGLYTPLDTYEIPKQQLRKKNRRRKEAQPLSALKNQQSIKNGYKVLKRELILVVPVYFLLTAVGHSES
jgi:hypothetical protein